MNKRDRIPPNQKVTTKFPVLHVGSVPEFEPEKWDFIVNGLVKNRLRLSYEEFMNLPSAVSVSDFHCVTGWSRLDNKWEGVSFKTIVNLVKPLENARYVTVIAEGDYNTSLPLEDL
ncbi:MAG: molybdopterin-dependent oxidoreductase, partial [Candidatus Bathyarchaeota archaeon]|nr:molybdopterin-dependent oxidoreductase [Candidatus Bathyarchaeota archaeon]